MSPDLEMLTRIYTILILDRYDYCVGCETEQPNQLAHTCMSSTFEEMLDEHLLSVMTANLSTDDILTLCHMLVRQELLRWDRQEEGPIHFSDVL